MSEKAVPPDATDEYQLIQRIVAGNYNAYEKLVLRYQAMITSFMIRQVGDPILAEELSQDAFVKAYSGLLSFRKDSKFSTWLIRIALNVSNSYFSSRRYKEKLATTSFDPKVHENFFQKDDNTYSEEELLLLRRFIVTLKAKYREVLILLALEDKSYAEVSEILNIPIGTVSSRMTTALETLRKQFERTKR